MHCNFLLVSFIEIKPKVLCNRKIRFLVKKKTLFMLIIDDVRINNNYYLLSNGKHSVLFHFL